MGFIKKSKEIVGILVVILMTVCSCTTDSIEQTPMLKRIVEVSVDGPSNITTLSYDENKIVNIDKVDKFLKFYYTDDLITKVEDLDKTTQHLNTLNYAYSDGKLNEITSSDKYVINYIHNNDGSISYEKWTKDANHLEVKNSHGILYFQNENLVKVEKILEDAGLGILSKSTIILEYDYKNNALKNILGFDKLLDYSEIISSNNAVISTDVSSIKYITEDQITSSLKRIESQYKYNSLGYPTEMVSENILFGGSDSKYVKTQLFYN